MHKYIVKIPSGVRNFIASMSSLTDNSKLRTMAIVWPDCRVQNLTLYRSKVKFRLQKWPCVIDGISSPASVKLKFHII